MVTNLSIHIESAGIVDELPNTALPHNIDAPFLVVPLSNDSRDDNMLLCCGIGPIVKTAFQFILDDVGFDAVQGLEPAWQTVDDDSDNILKVGFLDKDKNFKGPRANVSRPRALHILMDVGEEWHVVRHIPHSAFASEEFVEMPGGSFAAFHDAWLAANNWHAAIPSWDAFQVQLEGMSLSQALEAQDPRKFRK